MATDRTKARIESQQAAYLRAKEMLGQFESSMGIPASAPCEADDPLSDEQVLEEAFLTRWEERGLS